MGSEKSPYRKDGYGPMRKPKKKHVFKERLPGKAELRRNFKNGRGKHTPAKAVKQLAGD